jgi:hypothetical protein
MRTGLTRMTRVMTDDVRTTGKGIERERERERNNATMRKRRDKKGEEIREEITLWSAQTTQGWPRSHACPFSP